MSIQRISLTQPNGEWLKQHVESHEYTYKSELINDLIRQARKHQAEIDWLKLNLEKAEKSGFTKMGPAEILAESKARLNG